MYSAQEFVQSLLPTAAVGADQLVARRSQAEAARSQRRPRGGATQLATGERGRTAALRGVRVDVGTAELAEEAAALDRTAELAEGAAALDGTAELAEGAAALDGTAELAEGAAATDGTAENAAAEGGGATDGTAPEDVAGGGRGSGRREAGAGRGAGEGARAGAAAPAATAGRDRGKIQDSKIQRLFYFNSQ